MTGSRGGLIALVVGSLVFVAAWNFKKVLLYSAFGALAAAALWLKGPQVFRERAESLTSLEEDYNATSVVGRTAIWKRGIGYTVSNPLTGVGLQNFAVAEGRFFEREGMAARWFTAHNSYVQAFAELGIPGGLIFLSLLGTGFRRGVRLWRQPPREQPQTALWRPEFLAAVTSFSVSGFFLSHAYAFMLWTLLGYISLADRVRRTELGLRV